MAISLVRAGRAVGSPSVDARTKSTRDQISEIAKLIADAQDKLDQAARALHSVEGRLSDPDGPWAGDPAPPRSRD